MEDAGDGDAVELRLSPVQEPHAAAGDVGDVRDVQAGERGVCGIGEGVRAVDGAGEARRARRDDRDAKLQQVCGVLRRSGVGCRC